MRWDHISHLWEEGSQTDQWNISTRWHSRTYEDICHQQTIRNNQSRLWQLTRHRIRRPEWSDGSRGSPGGWWSGCWISPSVRPAASRSPRCSNLCQHSLPWRDNWCQETFLHGERVTTISKLSSNSPPILKSSIRSWNCPCTSPQTVTGHLTAWTLLSLDKISFAFSHNILTWNLENN